MSNRDTTPVNTFDRKTWAVPDTPFPMSYTAMPHGPLTTDGVPNVPRKFPLRSTTASLPACAVAEVPSAVGRLPINTRPSERIPRAALSPGADEVKKVDVLPALSTRKMVVPVPCRFCELLKFETRMSPGWRMPPAGGTVFGAKATPYGFTSPLDGIVDTDGGSSGKILCAANVAEMERRAKTAVLMLAGRTNAIEVFMFFLSELFG